MTLDKNNKKMVWGFAALCVAVVGLVVYAVVSQFKPSKQDQTERQSIEIDIPDGVAQEMADRKSDAFRGKVSTAEYYEYLGDRAASADEDISLVSAACAYGGKTGRIQCRDGGGPRFRPGTYCGNDAPGTLQRFIQRLRSDNECR